MHQQLRLFKKRGIKEGETLQNSPRLSGRQKCHILGICRRSSERTLQNIKFHYLYFTCMYVCVYTYTYTNTHTCVCMCVCVCVCVCVCSDTKVYFFLLCSYYKKFVYYSSNYGFSSDIICEISSTSVSTYSRLDWVSPLLQIAYFSTYGVRWGQLRLKVSKHI